MLVFCSSVSGRSSTPTSRSFWRKRSIASSNAVLGVSPDIPSNSVALGANVKFGVFLPISGRAASAVLTDAARRAEALGDDSVWAAGRIVTPWEINTRDPYSAHQRFIVPPHIPFLAPLTCLAFLAGCTQKIALGMSVLVMPYRHPLYWAKIATTIDHLSKGRLILGVGVGWMVEEFEALGAAFKDRGALSDEQLKLLDSIWKEQKASFDGRYYHFDEVGFSPKPLQKPRVPIWIR